MIIQEKSVGLWYMNRGFIPLVIIAIASLVGALTAGGAYTVYKINSLHDENEAIKTELQKQKVLDMPAQELVKDSEYDELSPEVYYVIGTTNVRDCASKSCDVLFTLSMNHEIKSAYQKLEFMPEWLDVSFDGGVVGYIHKTTLSEEKTGIVNESNAVGQSVMESVESIAPWQDTEKSEALTQIKETAGDKYDWDEISKSTATLREKREYYEERKKDSEGRLNDMDGAKDIYTKWSPIVFGTLAEAIAHKGYEQAVAVAASEYEISKELGNIISAINATLLIIKNKDEKNLVESINNYRSLEEKYVESYTKHVALYRTATKTLEDFRKALESLGFKMN